MSTRKFAERDSGAWTSPGGSALADASQRGRRLAVLKRWSPVQEVPQDGGKLAERLSGLHESVHPRRQAIHVLPAEQHDGNFRANRPKPYRQIKPLVPCRPLLNT